MNRIMAGLRASVVRLWEAIPSSRARAIAVWVLGLALGALGFWASLGLPNIGLAMSWLAVALFSLFLVFRAEPLLWTSTPRVEQSEPDQKPAIEPTPRPVTPSLLDMVPLPGGVFRMGSEPATDAEIREYAADWAALLGKKKPEEAEADVRSWRSREEPAHPVRVSAFSIARVPLTRGQWRALMPKAPAEWDAAGGDDELPATHVDWTQALELCNALSEREGLQPCYHQDGEGRWHWERNAEGYRLPTEAEWEYACRAGTQSRWFWGDEPQGAEEHAWYRRNSKGQIQAVARKTPNPWQLHDMAGLVYEWCWDRYGPYSAVDQQPAVNPAGPDEGELRVVRGGSFQFPALVRRSANRGGGRPDDRGITLGLRCVRSRVRQP